VKALTESEKTYVKQRFSVTLTKALKRSPLLSFRGLALTAGMEPSHLQRIATGQSGLLLTTPIPIAERLGLTWAQLADIYVNLTDDEITRYLEEIDSRKRSPRED
jgi:hypothetical protein